MCRRKINDCKLKKNPRARKDKEAVQTATFANCDFPLLGKSGVKSMCVGRGLWQVPLLSVMVARGIEAVGQCFKCHTGPFGGDQYKKRNKTWCTQPLSLSLQVPLMFLGLAQS